jgi:hypothetical protein
VPLKHALISACLVTLAPRTAAAVQYEVFISIETETDLYDLLVTEQISEQSFNALLELHQTRVELNRAGREQLYLLPNLDFAHVDGILAYRKRVGVIRALDDLVAAGTLEAEIAKSIRAFVRIDPPDAAKAETDGFARVQMRWSGRHDRLPPAAAAQTRLRALRRLDVGAVAVLTRNQIGPVRWDRSRRALNAEPERARFALPKAYVHWKQREWEIIVGTYRIGFGQRLTFDVTDQVMPNGLFGDYEFRQQTELELRCRRGPGERMASPCPTDRVARVTPDYAWSNRLSGLAVGARALSVGQGHLQAYAWGSSQVHRLAQSEVVDASTCADPRRDDEPGCRAPPVYARETSPTTAASTITFASLPAMYAEALGGMNVTYFWNERARMGSTGYGAVPKWLVRGAKLDFQETARKPFGGPFGAVGIDAAFGFGIQDFFAEVARSFDKQLGGGGGFGALVRSVTTLAAVEVDASIRYYASSFANPYARPISAPDELDGLRARDEIGLRIRTTARPGRRVGLRTAIDGWRALSTGALRGLLFARLDVQLLEPLAWAVWTEYQDTEELRILLATELAYEPRRRFVLSGQFQHRSVGGRPVAREAQQDIVAVLGARIQPIDVMRIRLRLRYDFEDIGDNHRLPHTVWAYLDTALVLGKPSLLRLRYDLRAFLDRRESTLVRVPNPEHWLWIEYVVRF